MKNILYCKSRVFRKWMQICPIFFPILVKYYCERFFGLSMFLEYEQEQHVI